MGAGGRSGADGRDKTGGKSRGFGADRRSRAPTGRTDGLHEEGWERGAEGGGAEQMAGQIHRRRAGTDAGEAASPRDHRGPRRGPPGPRPEDLLPPPPSSGPGRAERGRSGVGAGPVGGPRHEATRPGLTSLQLLQRGRQQPGPVAAAAHDRQQREAARPRGGTGRSRRRRRRRHLRRPPLPRRPQATPPLRQRRQVPPTDVTGSQWEGEARGEREEGARRERRA